MNSETGESGPDSSGGRAPTIRVAAPTALKELDQLRSVGSVGQEAADVAVAHLSYSKLRPQGYDPVVQHRRDYLARLLIKIRRGEAGYDLIMKSLHENKGLPLQIEGV
jgi:hypothetical protein